MMSTLPPPLSFHNRSSIPAAWDGLPAETRPSPAAASPGVFLPDLPLRTWLFIAGYCALFVLCLIGDIAVAVMVHGLGKRRGGTVYYFVLNILLADLLIGIFCTPFTLVGNTQEGGNGRMYDRRPDTPMMPDTVTNRLCRDGVSRRSVRSTRDDKSLSRVLCRMTPLIEGVVVCGSTFTLAAIVVTSYSQRDHRSPDVSTKKIAYVLCCIWSMAIIINIPQAFARDALLTSNPSGETYRCQETWGNSQAYLLYKGVLVALGFPGPLLFIVFAHLVGVTGLPGLKKNQDATTFYVTTGENNIHEGHTRGRCLEETVISPDGRSNPGERNRLFGGTNGDFIAPEAFSKDLSADSSINDIGNINTVACCAGTSCNNCDSSKTAFPRGHAGADWPSPPSVLSADYSMLVPTPSVDTVEESCANTPNTLPDDEQSRSLVPVSDTTGSEESELDKTKQTAYQCSTLAVSSHLLRALTVLFLITWLPFYTCWALDTYAKLTNTTCKNIHEYFHPISQWIAFSNMSRVVVGSLVGFQSCWASLSWKGSRDETSTIPDDKEFQSVTVRGKKGALRMALGECGGEKKKGVFDRCNVVICREDHGSLQRAHATAYCKRRLGLAGISHQQLETLAIDRAGWRAVVRKSAEAVHREWEHREDKRASRRHAATATKQAL
ncbi:G-protein coupled receptor [Branchiostoma belcheri]|nr:G-protein coupled receptor [Branchiostoma belcheri]